MLYIDIGHIGYFWAIYGWFCNIWRPLSDDDFTTDLAHGEKFNFSVYLITYFVVTLSKTYSSLVSTSSLSIYDKTVTKKYWSLSKIVFWTSKQPFAIYFLLATCNVRPVAIPEIFAKTQVPITGNSFNNLY